MKHEEKIEIPFGAKDSELCRFEYTIPEGMEAEIKDGKVIIRQKEKETEDERIRKGLLEFLDELWHLGTETNFDRWSKVDCSDWIDYLKKLKDFQFDYPGLYFYDGEKLHFQGNPAMEENQKEQKPAECLKPERDCWYVCIKDFYGGGKKQSSKGDLVQAKGGMYIMGRKDISEWFRKAYYDEIKPTEWSEEDEKMLNTTIGTLKMEQECWKKTGTCLNSDIQKCIDWLKSLRPQPHWKPSEEQMEALNEASAIWMNVRMDNSKLLESLYNDLKKLM